MKIIKTSFTIIIAFLLQSCNSNSPNSNNEKIVKESSPSPVVQSNDFTKLFIGTINDKYKIEMTIIKTGNSINGNYKYSGKQNSLKINGTIDNTGNFTINEFNDKGNMTGIFKGQLANTQANGQWSVPDGSKTMPFSISETSTNPNVVSESKENNSENTQVSKAENLNNETPNGKEITIGNQIWTAKNLDVSTFRNGDEIPQVTSQSDYQMACRNSTPVWCYYNFDASYGKKYGKLYNIYAVRDSRGLAPEGWHIPKNEEWEKLINSFGKNTNDAGTIFKSNSGWKDNRNGINSSGFTGLPGGCVKWIHKDDSPRYKMESEAGSYGYWWASDSYPYSLGYDFTYFNLFTGAKESFAACSVRCVKN